MTKKKVYTFLTLFVLIMGCTPNQQISSQCMPSLAVIPDVSNFPSPGYIDAIPGGSTNAIFAQGDYVYTNIGNQFVVLEVTNPAEPKLAGCLLLPGFVANITIVESYAYVVVGGQNPAWYVIDISQPSHPIQLVNGKDEYFYVPTLAVVDHYLYVSDFDLGLEIFDITNPGTPIEVRHYSPYDGQQDENFLPFQVRDLVVSGQYIYVTGASGNSHKLLLLDISNRVEPYLAGSYQMASGFLISHVAVSGDYAYIATYLSGDWFGNNPQVEIHVLDVSNPESIFEVGKYASKGGISVDNFAIQGDHLYVAHSIKDVIVIDVTTPTSPIEVGALTISPTGVVSDMAIAENRLYIAGGAVGLQIVDITDPAEPLELGYYTALGAIDKFQVKENIAHIVTLGEWRMVNIANPDEVVPLGGLGREVLGRVTNVVTKDNYAYLSFAKEKESGLHVVDIKNLNSPTLVDTYLFPGSRFDEVASSGSVLYLSDSTQTVILDISNPLNVTQIGTYQFEYNSLLFSDTLISGNFIIGIATGGLRFLDISNPVEPIEVSSYEGDVPFASIAVSGEYIYALNSPDILKVFTMQNLPHLEEVSAYQFPIKIVDLSADNENLYVAVASGDLLIFKAETFIP